MVHVMRVALFLTPVANVGAQFAYLFGEWAITGDCIGAQPADCGTLDAARRAVVFALDTDHMCEAITAFGRAEVAGVDAVLGELVHSVIHAGLTSFVQI